MIRTSGDDGIAPVIAMLLILAVIVTVMSVYFNTYVPFLKEEAEIDHLSDVQKEFLSFSSDLENAVWQKSEGRLSRSFELGGGDVFLSSVRSGGVLEVESDIQLFNITNSSDVTYNSSLVKYSYEPINNFWQDQGYSWQYGYVNLTTEYGEETPLQFTDMDSVIDDINSSSGIFSSLFNMEYRYVSIPELDGDGNYIRTVNNCTEVTLTITGLEKGEKDYVSGNGVAMLSLETAIDTFAYNEAELSFSVNNDSLFNVSDTIWKSINEKLVELNNQGFANVVVSCNTSANAERTGDATADALGITFTGEKVKVNIQQIDLTISAKA